MNSKVNILKKKKLLMQWNGKNQKYRKQIEGLQKEVVEIQMTNNSNGMKW